MSEEKILMESNQELRSKVDRLERNIIILEHRLQMMEKKMESLKGQIISAYDAIRGFLLDIR